MKFIRKNIPFTTLFLFSILIFFIVFAETTAFVNYANWWAIVPIIRNGIFMCLGIRLCYGFYRAWIYWRKPSEAIDQLIYKQYVLSLIITLSIFASANTIYLFQQKKTDIAGAVGMTTVALSSKESFKAYSSMAIKVYVVEILGELYAYIREIGSLIAEPWVEKVDKRIDATTQNLYLRDIPQIPEIPVYTGHNVFKTMAYEWFGKYINVGTEWLNQKALNYSPYARLGNVVDRNRDNFIFLTDLSGTIVVIYALKNFPYFWQGFLKLNLTLYRFLLLFFVGSKQRRNQLTYRMSNGFFSNAWDMTLIFLGIKKPQDTSYGSAEWAKNRTARLLINEKNKGLLVDGEARRLNTTFTYRHLLLIGPTGQGKTTRYILPNLLSLTQFSQQSLVITDVKGEIFASVSTYLESMGYECRRINLGGDTSHTYNPLLRANTDEEIAKIAKILVNIGTEGNKDAFWNNQATQLIMVFIHTLKNYYPNQKIKSKDDKTPPPLKLSFLLEMTKDEDNRNELLIENARYCTLQNVNTLAKYLQYRKNDVREFIKTYADEDQIETFNSIAEATEKTFSNVVSTVLSALQPIDFSKAKKITSSDSIAFEELRSPDKKVALFIQNKKGFSYKNLIRFKNRIH